jgi:serine/threonine protein kinase
MKRKSCLRKKTTVKKKLRSKGLYHGGGFPEKKDPYSLFSKKVCGDVDLYLGDIMAGGSYFIYKLCADPVCDHHVPVVAKIYKLDREKSVDVITKEVEFMRFAHEIGVAPKVEGFEVCEYDGVLYGVFLMELYGDGTLSDLINSDIYAVEENREKIHAKLREILDALYQNNISHNDLHSDNFLYQIGDDGDIELKIIDFDMADELGDAERNYRITDKTVLGKLKGKDFKTQMRMIKEGFIRV